jgi:hypothetical protein
LVLVDLDTLAALDALQWLRTGEEASRRFAISAASVSRQSRKCLDLFGLELQRVDGEWNIVGDSSILLLERRVHQTARWMGRRPLRLEATYWSGPLLCSPVPEDWILGLSNIVGVPRNFQLVRERIVDVCLAALPDGPSEDDPELTSLALSSMPVFFVVRADHPLVSKPNLTYYDIAEYPTLGLPGGAYPLVEASLKAIGLWNDFVRMSRYRREAWEGKTEAELTVGYGTALSMEVSGAGLVPLPLNLPFVSGELMVVRREFCAHPRLLALREVIVARLELFADRFPEIRLEPPGPWLG